MEGRREVGREGGREGGRKRGMERGRKGEEEGGGRGEERGRKGGREDNLNIHTQTLTSSPLAVDEEYNDCSSSSPSEGSSSGATHTSQMQNIVLRMKE